MGLGNWCRDRWVMMLRTKPQYLPMLTRKTSNLINHPKISIRDRNTCGDTLSSVLCVATMCCSVTCGVLLVLFEGVEQATTATSLVCLVVAALSCISGGCCLSEYLSPGARSVYSCSYQRSGEILAFTLGWAWILSQTSLAAAACNGAAEQLSLLSGPALKQYLGEGGVVDAVFTAIPALTMAFVVFTGVNETSAWHVVFGTLNFFLVAAVSALAFVSRDPQWLPLQDVSWQDLGDVNQMLALSSFCVLFFSGPQHILRQTSTRSPGKSNGTAPLVHLNFICLLLSIAFLCAPKPHQLATQILRCLCQLLLGIEALFPLYSVIEDMASDGLLFRGFAKKWRPCCLPVPCLIVQLLASVSLGLLAFFLPIRSLLYLSVTFVLMVNSIIPFLVLVKRYRDNSSWQYEPMIHTSDRRVSHDRSKRSSQEAEYTKLQETETFEISTACIAEDPSEESSDTDIDSVVQQYKDQARITNLNTLDGPTKLEQVPEPTPSSSVRAMVCVGALLALSLITSVTLNFADAGDHFPVMIVVMICVFFSAVVQGLLLCLPQNRLDSESSKGCGCCKWIPNMPWGPGMASLLASSLLVHSLTQIWKVFIGWSMVGLLIYFVYGMRSSTAANSFHHMRPAHITLRPLPSYGNNCVPQILPSHRKLMSRKQKRIKKVLS